MFRHKTADPRQATRTNGITQTGSYSWLLFMSSFRNELMWTTQTVETLSHHTTYTIQSLLR